MSDKMVMLALNTTNGTYAPLTVADDGALVVSGGGGGGSSDVKISTELNVDPNSYTSTVVAQSARRNQITIGSTVQPLGEEYITEPFSSRGASAIRVIYEFPDKPDYDGMYCILQGGYFSEETNQLEFFDVLNTTNNNYASGYFGIYKQVIGQGINSGFDSATVTEQRLDIMCPFYRVKVSAVDVGSSAGSYSANLYVQFGN